MVAREASEGKDRSFNASQIVHSLVEANRDKLKKQSEAVPVPKIELFHRVEQFKLFPKKKSSIDYTQAFNSPFHSSSKNKNEKAEQLLEFAPRRPSTPTTERPPVRFVHRESPLPQPFRPSLITERVRGGHQFSESNNYSFREVSPTSECKRSFISEGKGEGSGTACLFDDISKKRQELSDELRLISSKIDHSIDELKKQNTSMSNSTTLTNGNKESVKKGEMEKARARIKTEGIPSSNITFSFAPSTPTHQSPTQPTESLFKGNGIKRVSVPMSKPKTSNAQSEAGQK